MSTLENSSISFGTYTEPDSPDPSEDVGHHRPWYLHFILLGIPSCPELFPASLRFPPAEVEPDCQNMYGEDKDGERRQWAGIWETSLLGGPQCCAFGRVAEVTAVECVRSGVSVATYPEMPAGLGKSS